MEMFSRQPQLNQILATYQKNEDYLRSCVQALRDWLEKQPHLPSAKLSDQFLEISLIQNKLSVEKTKSKIEFYCLTKSMDRYRYLFKKEIFVPSKDALFYLPFPVLTDENYRIYYAKLTDEDRYEMADEFSHHIIYRELATRHDYNNGEIFILDHSKATAKILTKFRPNVMLDGNSVILKCHSARVKQIHLVSPMGAKLFSFTKNFMPSKLVERFQIHGSVDDLKKIFPAKVLPKDFGGELKSLDELFADFDKLMASQSEKILEYLDTKSNEELRVDGPRKDEMQGTFMKLDID